MATQDRHGSLESTDNEIDTDQGRALRPRLTESGRTLWEAVATPLGLRPSPDFVPDGDWLSDEDEPLRKTWARERNGIKERVQLYSSGISGRWTVSLQRTDGRTETIAEDLEREAAFEKAEVLMADLAMVRHVNRTARAAKEINS